MSGGVMFAWLIAIAFSAWNSGMKPGGQDGKSAPNFPPPYVFLDATILFGGIGLLGRANPRIAGLLAFGLVLPLILIEFGRKNSPLASLPFALNTSQGKTPRQVQQQYGGS